MGAGGFIFITSIILSILSIIIIILARGTHIKICT